MSVRTDDMVPRAIEFLELDATSDGLLAAVDNSPALFCEHGFTGCAPAFTEIWQHLVDGLPEEIALLDRNWAILITNRSWAKASELYGHFSLIPGTSYLEFCRRLAGEGLEVAKDIVSGIEELAEGKRSGFELVYRASDPEVGNDYRLSVNQFEVAGQKFTSVTRSDITRLIELRRLREDFSGSVMREQAEDRRRIGREIHDSTMQLLASIGLMIGHLKQTSEAAASQPILEEMQDLLSEAQREIRSISYLIHPPVLGKLTLAEAVKSLVEGFARRTDLDVQLDLVDEPRLCCPAAEGAIYRVVQEALANVHRHSHARHATVRLSQGQAVTHVVISDDGTGIPAAVASGVGLSGMRARLAELGGRLTIRRRSPGTAVIASVPSDRGIINRARTRARDAAGDAGNKARNRTPAHHCS